MHLSTLLIDCNQQPYKFGGDFGRTTLLLALFSNASPAMPAAVRSSIPDKVIETNEAGLDARELRLEPIDELHPGSSVRGFHCLRAEYAKGAQTPSCSRDDSE